MGGKSGSRYDNAFTRRRREFCLSISTLSQKTGVPTSTLIQWEEGYRRELPRKIEYANAYCSFFGITLSELRQDLEYAYQHGKTGVKGKPFVANDTVLNFKTNIVNEQVLSIQERNMPMNNTDSDNDKRGKDAVSSLLDNLYGTLDRKEYDLLIFIIKDEYKEHL